MKQPVLWFDEYIHLDPLPTCRYFLPPDRWLSPQSGKGLLVSILAVGVGPAITAAHKPLLSFGQSAMPTDVRGGSTDSPFNTLHSQDVDAGSKYYTLSFGVGGVAPAPIGYFAFSLACHADTAATEWSAVRLRIFVAEAA